jgi:hypothetical protein
VRDERADRGKRIVWCRPGGGEIDHLPRQARGIQQGRDRDTHKIRIAQELGATPKGPSHDFRE